MISLNKLLKTLDYLVNLVPQYVASAYISKGSLTINVHKESITQFSLLLKHHEPLRFQSLLDIWGVDRPERQERFKVGYNFLSIPNNLRFSAYLVSPKDGFVPSLTPLFKSAEWLEREAWDMFGIFFVDHPDLRRILTDYGFSGYPLRKDFPLSGYTQARYDEESKKVVLEPLNLEQEFRFFSFSSPWNQSR